MIFEGVRILGRPTRTELGFAGYAAVRFDTAAPAGPLGEKRGVPVGPTPRAPQTADAAVEGVLVPTNVLLSGVRRRQGYARQP